MKIAVTSTGQKLDDTVEARFGRCAYFLIIEPDTLIFESIPNPNISLGGGAGIQSAQLMASKGVSIVLTGNCGPNAFRTFGAAGIQVITGVTGRVRDAVGQFKAGTLTYSSTPNVQSHFGMGKGMGKGQGMGGGFRRSMNMETGAGNRGFSSSGPSQDRESAGTEKMESLKKTVTDLRGQIEALEARIRDLEKYIKGWKRR
jgi:predicted Fe-Mo cluster-binding NifX family protein